MMMETEKYLKQANKTSRHLKTFRSKITQ